MCLNIILIGKRNLVLFQKKDKLLLIKTIPMKNFKTLVGIVACAALFASCGQKKEKEVEMKIADFPLYEDPIFAGPTDPMVCYNPVRGSYLMYYTSRRSNDPSLGGIESVHGSAIGIAESKDGGASWEYIGNCEIDYAPDAEPTYWAPEVICHEGTFHMYLSYVPGIFDNWEHPRDIVHLTSKDGIKWEKQSILELSSNRVIDACIWQMPDGVWRFWYNDEPDNKSIYYAESTDLYHFTNKGKVEIDTKGEGPNVFFWNNRFYMIVDEWKGLSVFTSDDALNWTKQEKYLLAGVEGKMPHADHADVEVVGEHAYMFYFAHNLRNENLSPEENRTYTRCCKVYVTELELDEDGQLVCDPFKPCPINMMADK